MENIDRTDGEIRKISIGNDLKNAMHYQVGGTVGEFKISSIVEDIYDSFFLSTKSYIVNVSKDGINEVAWKRVERLPVTIEYKL